MDRRKFLETAGALAVIPVLGKVKEPPCLEPPKKQKSRLDLLNPNSNYNRLPVIQFDAKGQLENIEEIMQGEVAFDSDVIGKVYVAWLRQVDYVIVYDPYAYRGPIWGEVHVEVMELHRSCDTNLGSGSVRLFMGCIRPTQKSNRVECYRRPDFTIHEMSKDDNNT